MYIDDIDRYVMYLYIYIYIHMYICVYVYIHNMGPQEAVDREFVYIKFLLIY